MDLLKCEKCNCTITNFFNHRCFYREHSFDRIVSEMLDYNLGNIPQEIPATISHSAEGADFNTLALTNRTSTFSRSTDQERHWNVNSTAGTNARTMDLLRCEMCNSTITNFGNNRCFFNEYSYQGTGFENPDYIFGNNPQEIT
ncbi:hypothetical protein CDAR_253971 [Caerostris darwini]|uniref:Uncharacterized protein n=1 Tax=Caerostris darwini TaxID=1538125 RepID=A0AAV4PN84_9ARAC|nr:hypothetical protein CDAR_253971 [Caerostris darwini]